MSSGMTPFDPVGNTMAVTLGAANVQTALPQAIGSGTPQCQIYNASAFDAFVVFGVASAVAVIPTSGTPANGFPIAKGATIVLTPPPQAAFVGIIGPTGASGTVYLSFGEGN